MCQIRYEDLIEDPIQGLRSIYDQLDLGEFDAVLPDVESYVTEMAAFEKNQFQLSDEDIEKVELHWGKFIERFGYAGDRAA